MNSEKMTEVEIYTDGACRGNPGPGGWGVWMVSGPHEKELFGGELNTTNNRMELTAVITALRALRRPLPCDPAYRQSVCPERDQRVDRRLESTGLADGRQKAGEKRRFVAGTR